MIPESQKNLDRLAKNGRDNLSGVQVFKNVLLYMNLHDSCEWHMHNLEYPLGTPVYSHIPKYELTLVSR